MSAPRMHETWHPCTWRTCTLSRWGCAACSVMNISFTHTIPYPARERPLPRCSPVAKLRKCTGARERGSPNTHIHIHDEPITHSREKRAALHASLSLSCKQKQVCGQLALALALWLASLSRPPAPLYWCVRVAVWFYVLCLLSCARPEGVCARRRCLLLCARPEGVCAQRRGGARGTWMSAPRMHETWHPCT